MLTFKLAALDFVYLSLVYEMLKMFLDTFTAEGMATFK